MKQKRYSWSVAVAATVSLMLLLAACGGSSGGCEGSDPACVWAGLGEAGLNGDGLPLTETRLYWPIDLEFGPDGTAWLLDWNNHLLRRVTPDGRFETVIGQFVGDGPPDQSDLSPPGAPGRTVRLNHPTDMQFGPDGLLYITTWHNHKVRVLDPATGLVTVLGGRGPGFAGDGGPVAKALFDQVKAIAFAPDGSFFVLDQRNQRVRRISAAPERTVTTVAGTGVQGFNGDDLPASQAQLAFETGPQPDPSGALAYGPDGMLYIADALNYRIRRVDLAADRIETVAGTGQPGLSGDGGPALSARLGAVTDLEFGPDGRLYIADSTNNCIRALDLRAGTIENVWNGGGTRGSLTGDARKLNRPLGIAFGPDGHLYIADTFNNRVLRIDPTRAS